MTRARVHCLCPDSHSVTMVRKRPSRMQSSAQRATVLDAVRRGQSVTEAAEAAGVARETAQRWCRAASLRRCDRHAEELERARRSAVKPATPGASARGRTSTSPDEAADLRRQLDAAHVRLEAVAAQLEEERALRESKDRELRELRQREPWQRRAVELALGTLDVLPWEVWTQALGGSTIELRAQVGRERAHLHSVQLNPDHVAALREAVNLAESMRLDLEDQRADRPIATSRRARRDRLARNWRGELYGDSAAGR